MLDYIVVKTDNIYVAVENEQNKQQKHAQFYLFLATT
jgi:hypothetical protein